MVHSQLSEMIYRPPAMLVVACRADQARVLTGRNETIGVAMAVERGHLLSCATEGVDLAEVVFPLVDKQGCVTVKTNFYSVPARSGTPGGSPHPSVARRDQACRSVDRAP
jgi:hypothetical protein